MQELLRSKDGWVEYPFSEICWFQEGTGVRNHQFTSAGVKLFNGTNIEKGKIDLDKKIDTFRNVKHLDGTHSS
jgi:type I restriction enzyme, S subunit